MHREYRSACVSGDVLCLHTSTDTHAHRFSNGRDSDITHSSANYRSADVNTHITFHCHSNRSTLGRTDCKPDGCANKTLPR